MFFSRLRQRFMFAHRSKQPCRRTIGRRSPLHIEQLEARALLSASAADFSAPLAAAAASNVVVHFTATASLVSGSPFGKTSAQIQGRVFSGFFTYDSSTAGVVNNLNSDAIDYKLTASEFQIDIDGVVISGSGSPAYRIVDRDTFLDQIQFADGTSTIPTSPFDGGTVNVNGVADATAGIYLSISADPATLDNAALPNPFPFDTDDFAPNHLFTLKQGSNSTIILNIDSIHPEVSISTFHVTQFNVGPSGFEAEFSANLDASVLNLYDLGIGGLGASDVTLVGNSVGPVKGSLVVDSGLRKVTFIKTSGPLLPDTYTLTLRSAANAFKDAAGNLLDGNSNGTAGDAYVQVFGVEAPTRTIGFPNITRGPGQQVAVPATGNGIPLVLSDAAGVTSLTLNVAYDPALLHITSAIVGSGLPAGAAASVDTNSTPGIAKITFSSPTPLSAGAKTLLSLQADVPAAAPYKATQVLRLQSLSLNGGTLSVVPDDALQVVDNFGDANADQQYTGFDASRISRVVVGLDTGFAPFLKVDPAVIADINADGNLTGFDASRISRVVVGLSVSQIPPLTTFSQALLSTQSLAAANKVPSQTSAAPAASNLVSSKPVETKTLAVSPSLKKSGTSLGDELTRSARREFFPKSHRPAAVDLVFKSGNWQAICPISADGVE